MQKVVITCFLFLFVQDFLQQPVMLFLNKDAELKKERVQSEHFQKVINCTKTNIRMINAASDLTLPDDDDRFALLF